MDSTTVVMNGEDMDEACDSYTDKACRESAHAMLRRQITELRRRADGLEALLNLVPDSPNNAEEALWRLVQGSLRDYR